MAEIGVKDLKATPAAVIDRGEAGTTDVVTKEGRPAAVLLPMEHAEDLALANASAYVRMRKQAPTDQARGRTASLAELD